MSAQKTCSTLEKIISLFHLMKSPSNFKDNLFSRHLKKTEVYFLTTQFSEAVQTLAPFFERKVLYDWKTCCLTSLMRFNHKMMIFPLNCFPPNSPNTLES